MKTTPNRSFVLFLLADLFFTGKSLRYNGLKGRNEPKTPRSPIEGGEKKQRSKINGKITGHKNRRLGGKASHGKSGSGSGWSNGIYYGCLSLSSNDTYIISAQGKMPNCDYVVHSRVTESNKDSAENNLESGSERNNKDGDGSSQETGAVVVNSLSENISPYEAFNVSRCDTYEDLWTWDVMMTCNETIGYENCACTFAEELMEMKLLSCEDEKFCPSDCAICNECLSLLGCSRVPAGRIFSRKANGSAIQAAAAIVTVTGLYLLANRSRRKRNRQGNNLSSRLLSNDEEKPPAMKKVWLVPLDSNHQNEDDQAESPVWIAPLDIPTEDCYEDRSLVVVNVERCGTCKLGSREMEVPMYTKKPTKAGEKNVSEDATDNTCHLPNKPKPTAQA